MACLRRPATRLHRPFEVPQAGTLPLSLRQRTAPFSHSLLQIRRQRRRSNLNNDELCGGAERARRCDHFLRWTGRRLSTTTRCERRQNRLFPASRLPFHPHGRSNPTERSGDLREAAEHPRPREAGVGAGARWGRDVGVPFPRGLGSKRR